MKTHEVMIDIETLDNLPTSTILSIGAVMFSFEDGEIIDTFYQNVDPVSCIQCGLTTSRETAEWWMTQNIEAWKSLLTNRAPLRDSLDRFTKWIGYRKVNVWGNGANFDIVVMENAYRACKMTHPWKYHAVRCYRTINSMYGTRNNKFDEGVKHNALDDAMFQTKELLKIVLGRDGGNIGLLGKAVGDIETKEELGEEAEV